MERFGKRKLTLLLAACLLLGLLAGCGKKDNAQQLSASVYVPRYLDLNLNLDYVRGGCSDGENIYLIGQIENQKERQDPDTGDKYVYSEYVYDIYRISLEDGTADKLPNYVGPSIPEGKEGSAYIDDITPGADGTLWVREIVNIWGDMDSNYPGIAIDSVMPRTETAETATADAADSEADADDEAEDDGDASADDGIAADAPIADEPSYYEPQETILRRQLGRDGNELARIDLSNLEEKLADKMEEDTYINGISFDNNGNIYTVTTSRIYVLSPQLELLFSLEGEDMWGDLILLNNGTVGMQKWDYDDVAETSSSKLITIDPVKQDWGPEYTLDNTIYNIYPGGGDYLYYYQINDAIFGWKAGEAADDGTVTGEGERLFSWIEADINRNNVRNFFFLPDGRVAVITQEWTDDGKGRAIISVALMTSTPREQLPEKTTLIYATMYLNYDARNKIIDFNKKSEKYRIEVKDYSEYVTNDNDSSAAIQKLNTEILAGTVPDILDTNSLPIRIYGSKGILEDLWPYIESDPDLGRDALMVRPLEANQQDGKLYEIFSTFSIRTAVGSEKIVGDRTSWNLAELQAALANMPDGCTVFGVTDTQEQMLNTVLALNMDQFVDWNTGACSFDSDAFKSLLSFCGSFPATFSYEDVDWDEWEDEEVRILNGKQLLYHYYLNSFDSWDMQRLSAIFRDDFSFIGYPKEDGSCGSCFSISRGVAMTSSCRDKDGAWSFIRQVLLPQTEDGEPYYGVFPINKSDFDRMVETALEPVYEADENGDPLLDENGDPVLADMGTMWITGDLEIPMRTTTQEDVDKVMALYNAVDSIYRYDEKIYDAVAEVAGQYFAGDKPLDEAARLIQSKVSLYVNESR